MSDEKPKKIATNNRAMSASEEDGKEVFFFPKRNPPITVRATSLEEAEKLLEDTNHKEI